MRKANHLRTHQPPEDEQMPIQRDVTAKTALVTGRSHGIAADIAKILAEGGAAVAITEASHDGATWSVVS